MGTPYARPISRQFARLLAEVLQSDLNPLIVHLLVLGPELLPAIGGAMKNWMMFPIGEGAYLVWPCRLFRAQQQIFRTTEHSLSMIVALKT